MSAVFPIATDMFKTPQNFDVHPIACDFLIAGVVWVARPSHSLPKRVGKKH